MNQTQLKIAIAGRPNVGKSALFNRITGKRIAIVDEAEGVTRDRIYAPATLFGNAFELIDTGGIALKSDAPFNALIRAQALSAIKEADGLIFVVDGQVGTIPLDLDLARLLLKTKKPLVCAVNKIDERPNEATLCPFASLGIAHSIAVSATHGRNIAELLLPLLEQLEKREEPAASDAINVAILGRPNAGKSTLVNTLLCQERCITSPIAGTTRDSIDIPLIANEKPYILIDTAGIRRKNKENDVIEKFASIRTTRAIERADVCVLMLDVREGMTTEEKRIATQIEKAGKGCVVLLNKWDLVKNFRQEHCSKAISVDNPFLAHCPILPTSAKVGDNLNKLFSLCHQVHEGLHKRVSTNTLNNCIEKAMQLYHPPRLLGKRLRVYYATQAETNPPTVVLFVNHPSLMIPTYKRYLSNQLRKEFGFKGAPLRLFLKPKKTKSAEVRTQHRVG